MPSISTQPGTDPLSRAIAGSAFMAGRRQVPLVSTAYDIQIRGGLADVTAIRAFRNDEPHSIEATLTFPLPVHAVLYGLEARIGGRLVRALAQPRRRAREIYEDAIDRGKTTVLHEELLKGVHLLSVGHVAPATEITVTARFAVALARVGERVLLHIPTTVGDIYGESGLPDSDEICHGAAAVTADLKVAADVGEPLLLAGALRDGSARIPLDAPIHIEVMGWHPRALKGRAADGRWATLSIAPAPAGSAAIAAAVVIDHSGSMSSLCAGGGGISKHAAALLGLSEAASDLRAGDQLHLWQFNDQVHDLGCTTANAWRAHIRKLSAPTGGTEIGRALDAVMAAGGVGDVVLVTDGKSHALDVARLARSGVRFTVVLIGEDSLEANVGHLAALTGGEIFVPDGANVADALASALASLRRPAGDPREGNLRRSGMAIKAGWMPEKTLKPLAAGEEDGRAVAAYAASLLLAAVGEAEALRIAQAEGLVTHLTSLVLVDEEGTAQAGLPATRKVILPSPRTLAASLAHLGMEPAQSLGRPRAANPDPVMGSMRASMQSMAYVPEARPPRREAPARARAEMQRLPHPGPPDAVNLAALAARISWSSLRAGAAGGDLSALDNNKSKEIRAAADLPLVRKLAGDMGLAPAALVLGLMARWMAARDRHAARIARALLGRVTASSIAPIAELLGLAVHDQPAA